MCNEFLYSFNDKNYHSHPPDARLLPCPQYLPLEKLGRCVHLDEAAQIIRQKYLPSFELKIESQRELVDTKVGSY
jgi:hypothetical protein